jgi:hypothetical protein
MKNIQGCYHRRGKKIEHLGCHVRFLLAWESIMPAVIYTCFTNCGFGTASSVNTISDEENSE